MQIIESTDKDGMVLGNFDFTEEIERGAALLDQYSPNWAESIDLSHLELESCAQCVLGQTAINAMLAPALAEAHEKVKKDYTIGNAEVSYSSLSEALWHVVTKEDREPRTGEIHEMMIAHGFLSPQDYLDTLYPYLFHRDEQGWIKGSTEAADSAFTETDIYDVLTTQWKDYIATRLNHRRERLELALNLIDNIPAQPVLTTV